MTLRRTLAMASAIAMAFSLTACGGGGGGGQTSLVSAPPPAPSAPPSAVTPAPAPPSLAPPPTASLPTITAAPTPASAGSSPAFPQAIAGGPTIAAPGGVRLPLLQTVRTETSLVLRPDPATIAAGATLLLEPSGSKATFDVGNPTLQVSNISLIKEPQTVYFETTGSTSVRLEFGALTWTAYGRWSAIPNFNKVSTYDRYTSDFVTGFQTPGGALPTTGSAAYTGSTGGEGGYLSGTAALEANYGSRTITGMLTGMEYGSWDDGYLPWNSVSLSASFASGQSGFSGTTAAATAPGNSLSLGAGAVGSIVGGFFGPTGNEIGAVWTLFDGTRSATGALGVKRQ